MTVARRREFLNVPPRAIAFCETSHDIAEVVRFARDREWPLRVPPGDQAGRSLSSTGC